jgi:hypothetical protein
VGTVRVEPLERPVSGGKVVTLRPDADGGLGVTDIGTTGHHVGPCRVLLAEPVRKERYTSEQQRHDRHKGRDREGDVRASIDDFRRRANHRTHSVFASLGARILPRSSAERQVVDFPAG